MGFSKIVYISPWGSGDTPSHPNNARSHPDVFGKHWTCPNDDLSCAFEVFSSQDEKKERETSRVSSVEPRIGVG